MGSRVALGFATVSLLVSGVGVAIWEATATEPAPRVVDAADVPLLVPVAPPSTAVATSTIAPPTLPSLQLASASAPVTPPTDEYAPEPVLEIGSIEIPKIGLVHRSFHGITMWNINRGPSHWPGTALPGEVGNAVFAGHRVTKSHPFRRIDELKPGDEVFFTVDPAAFGRPGSPVRTRYVVTGSEVVGPTAIHIVDPTPTATATLFACHPPGSARERYVVRLALAPPGADHTQGGGRALRWHLSERSEA